MKRLSLYLTVALLCCGQSSSFAQMRVLEGTPTLAPKLVSTSSNVDGGLPFFPANEDIPNPFDILGQAPAAVPAPPPPTSTSGVEIPIQNAIQAEIDEDPTSLHVGRRHRQRNAVVDTMANYGSSLASVPNASHAPVDWCYGNPRTPNPVANVLLRQECVEGLWDGYDAQRSAECAHMWSKLTAQKKCRGCSKCQGGSGCTSCASGSSTGCASGGCGKSRGGCLSGKCSAKPVNRYAPSGCDSCTHCAAKSQQSPNVQVASAATPVSNK